jgi:hypothetical protein
MKKKILIGVILSCFLLLVTPCINAVEYREVKDNIETQRYRLIDTFINSDKQLGIISSMVFLIYFVIAYILLFLASITYIDEYLLAIDTVIDTVFEKIILSIFQTIVSTMIFPFLLIIFLTLYLIGILNPYEFRTGLIEFTIAFGFEIVFLPIDSSFRLLELILPPWNNIGIKV